jgi:hypothetical protein
MSVSSGNDRCAGCGRSGSDAKRLLAARAPDSRLSICDVCVEESVLAMADAPTRIPGKARACAFCEKPEGQVAVLLVLGALGEQLICDECIDAYRTKV